MQPGLNLLIQLVLGFAPVMVNIIQKQTSSNSKTDLHCILYPEAN